MKIRILWLFMTILTIQGCKRENPNPESLDPIYNDFLSELRNFEQQKEDAIKKLEKAEKDRSNAAVHSIDKKTAESEIQKEQIRISKLAELIEYFKIRAQIRMVETRANYKRAFLKGEELNYQEEFVAYKQNKHLNRVSRRWDDRVPRSSMQQATFGDPAKMPVQKETAEK